MIGSIFVFLLVLSVLVLVHELGHFLVARKAGIWVEEFGFGIPPRIFSKKIGETIYSINLLPFGGFVKLYGESGGKTLKLPKKAFINKSKKVRFVIIIAGVVMNFILGILAFATVYSISGIPQESQNVKVIDIVAGSPAHEAGILTGDIVRSVEGEKVSSVEQFITIVEKNKGKRILLSVDRVVAEKVGTNEIYITPRVEHSENEGPLGVVITSVEIYFPPIWQRPFIGIYYGFGEAVFWGKTVVDGLAKTFVMLFRGQVPRDLAGPVGIFAITSHAASVGTLALINFVGILSVNLAILNILPFPALDGGRLAFLFLEKAIGRKVLPRIEAAVHTVGMIILLSLLLAITAQDIQRLIANGGINGFIDSILK